MRFASWYFRRLMLTTLLVVLLFYVIQLLRTHFNYIDNISTKDKLKHISQLIEKFRQETSNSGDGVVGCKLPQLDLLNPEILKFIHNVPPLSCTPKDWVSVDGSKVFIQDYAKKEYGSIACSLTEIVREDDFNTIELEAKEFVDSYILTNSDFCLVQCHSSSGEKLVPPSIHFQTCQVFNIYSIWNGILAGVKKDPTVTNKIHGKHIPNNFLRLNVVMFGFDSLSKNTFIRKLPKTYNYMRNKLKSLILDGYNIIGDGTPQALIPILTGKTELELPETRKRISNANYVNVYPFIWDKYKDKGYITGFMEDVADIGTFTYRLKGFQKQPTDHYMRTYYLAAAPSFKYSQKLCMGGIPRHMVMLNYMKNIIITRKNEPKFLFGFHGELSHDSYNDIGVADDDLLHWMEELNNSGYLNNTILIMMSDHGHRFAEIRNTLQGKQEERLPFFSFTFPSWFEEAYPRAYNNFMDNTQRLTTPFDIHKTLEHIISFQEPKDGNREERAISLFDKIPIERTCANAFIEPHWCACLQWKEISIKDPTLLGAARYLIESLNAHTELHRDICESLKLKGILWAAKLLPTQDLLTFKKSGDRDGFLGDFSDKTKVNEEIYQLKIKTEPGDGLYEASVTYNLDKKTFNTKASVVVLGTLKSEKKRRKKQAQ